MATDGSFKINVKVSERSTDKLIEAAVDTFSPATETLGLLGDSVRLARIEVAAFITKRAKVLADQHGLKLTAPPLKFLVPFYEKASTEDVEDKILIEMWAELLTSAGSDYSTKYLRYTSILSELSGSQANILHNIANNYGGIIGKDVDEIDLFYNFEYARLTESIKDIGSFSPEDILKDVQEMICMPGVCVLPTK